MKKSPVMKGTMSRDFWTPLFFMEANSSGLVSQRRIRTFKTAPAPASPQKVNKIENTFNLANLKQNSDQHLFPFAIFDKYRLTHNYQFLVLVFMTKNKKIINPTWNRSQSPPEPEADETFRLRYTDSYSHMISRRYTNIEKTPRYNWSNFQGYEYLREIWGSEWLVLRGRENNGGETCDLNGEEVLLPLLGVPEVILGQHLLDPLLDSLSHQEPVTMEKPACRFCGSGYNPRFLQKLAIKKITKILPVWL